MGETWPELDAAIEEHQLGGYADAIRPLARPVLLLDHGPEPEGPGCVSRVGGDPDLLPGTEWPVVDGRRLTFMAQLRLDELGIPAEWPLRAEGLLSVFKGEDEDRFDVVHKVLHYPDPEALAPTDPPEGLECHDEYHPRLGARTLVARPGVSLPGYGSAEVEALEFDDEALDRYLDLERSLGKSYGRMLGHDRDVDELPTLERARQVLGRVPPEQLHAEAARWVPLLELGSSHEIELCMWDYYAFLVLIRREDLAAGRYEESHALLART